ncbi:hypothetical protein [Immundisolibacter sp.]
MTTEHQADIYTLEQEALQMRARMNRLEQELEHQTKRTNAMAAVLIELRDIVTHDHEDKAAFIACVRGILGTDPDLRLCKRCCGIMRPGITMGQTWIAGIPDFPGQDACITMSPGGPGRVVDCMKCEACGWSLT